MQESEFQRRFKKRIQTEFPGCTVMKQDSRQIQGIPDLIILYKSKYAVLEMKKSEHANHRPNQDFYISKFGQWVYSSFCYPENEEEVITGLKGWFNE